MISNVLNALTDWLLFYSFEIHNFSIVSCEFYSSWDDELKKYSKSSP